LLNLALSPDLDPERMPSEQIPTVIASRYRVLGPVGEGNMGKVYLVEHIHTGEQFALKVLLSHFGTDPKVVKRFKREAWLPARIKSEHVAKVIDADVAEELGGAPFLVMELLDGCDLEVYLQRVKTVPPAEVVHILVQVGRALDKAHEIGIIHRDLKPENIFLHRRRDGSVIVKVLDFGISKIMGDGLGNLEDAALTRTGVVLGTPLYMPPEQATGDSARIGPRSDIWAIGLVAFRLLTGKLYWVAESVAELLVEILSTPMPLPSSIDPALPAAFNAWFARSCNRILAERWASVGEQVAALGAVFGVDAEHVRAPGLIRTLQSGAEASEPPPVVHKASRTMPAGPLPPGEEAASQERPASKKLEAIAPTEASDIPATPLRLADFPPPAAPAKLTKGPGKSGAPGGKRQAEAERRQLTIMACEILAPSDPAAKLDTKTLRELQREYLDAFLAAVRRADGYAEEIRTDGFSAYFGYPVAHEDDARQAVETAMDLVEIASQIAARSTRGRLDVRVGVHTGIVLAWEIRQGEGRPMAIAGATPTTATRLTGVAPRNTVVLSGSTHRLVEGYFACLSLGMRVVKGVSQPIDTYQVSHGSGARSRLEGAVSHRLTPIVGRDLEIGILMDRWARAEEGAGQVIYISGEAGIGKSRLLKVFLERLEAEAHVWIESRCLPHQRYRMLFPFAGIFRMMFRLDGETPAQNVDKLTRALKYYSFSLPDTLPSLASLLSLPLSAPYPKDMPPPEEEAQKVQEVLLAVLVKMAKRQPVVLAISDLHWADSASIALIGRIIQEIPAKSILVLLTARPVFVAPWINRTHVTSMPLIRLTPRRIKLMAEELTNGKALPASVLEQLIAKTDGIPLFVEELTKAILESGQLVEKGGEYELTGVLPQLVIPSTLRDSLMERFDGFGAAKRVAQLGAILGKEFSYEVLQATSGRDPAVLRGALERLVDAELLYVRGEPPRAKYTFKHVLMQDTAYESMLQVKRQGFHKKVAQILLAQFPDLVASQPAVLARHFTFAGSYLEAAPYWQQAAHRPLDASICEEATGYLIRELAQVEAGSPGADRDAQELALLASLCPLLCAAKGLSAPDVERAYARAGELVGKLPGTPDLAPNLLDLWHFSQSREELPAARALALQLLEITRATAAPEIRMQAHGALGETLFHGGDLENARAQLEQAIAYDPRDRARPILSPTGLDIGVSCLVHGAWTLWLMGYPEQALQQLDRAVTLARSLAHPETLYHACVASGHLAGCLGRGPLGAHVEAVNAISLEHPPPFSAAGATLLEGALLFEQGRVDEGIALMTEALKAVRASGGRLWLTCFTVFVADACQRASQAERGKDLLHEPRQRALAGGGDTLCQSEVHRLHGLFVLRLASGDPGQEGASAEAEHSFRAAIEVASLQEARLLALRAAVALGRLLRAQRRGDEVKGLLRASVQSIQEGLELPDMREAALLLHAIDGA
jgi:class 3 adenylate cyclase/tetratricopeptide (TPR) repeat protein